MHNVCNFLKLLFFNILGNNPFGIYILNVIKFTEKRNGIFEIFNKDINIKSKCMHIENEG